MILPLAENEEQQWSALDRKIRNQVRKAEKSELRVTQGGVELVEPFYDVFAHNMRDLGTPVYPRRWFQQILATFPDNARVFCVWLVTSRLPRRTCSGTATRWRSRRPRRCAASTRCAPNTLLYWEMLKFAAGRGVRNFDFGRSTPGAGTYDFKRQWGAQPHELDLGILAGIGR